MRQSHFPEMSSDQNHLALDQPLTIEIDEEKAVSAESGERTLILSVCSGNRDYTDSQSGRQLKDSVTLDWLI